MKKKLLSIICASALILGLASCGNNNATSSTSSTGSGSSGSGSSTSSGDSELRTVKFCLARTAEVLEDTPFWVAQNMGYMAEEGLTLEMIETFGTTDCKW